MARSVDAPDHPRFILASGSPRRRDLLLGAGFEFDIARPFGAESESRALSMRELTTLNATRKALEISSVHPDAVVLGADTLVSLDGAVVGKPTDFNDAIRIHHRLRGRTHQVCTSVFICEARARKAVTFFVISHVTFRVLDDAAIVRYLERIDPLDKAGAYAAQGDGAEIIESSDGSYTNVVGLPMDETIAALRDFGVQRRDHSGAERWQISSLFPSGSSKKNA
ncbi:MAG: Maf family protein [Verrucomicrobiota bacterium]|nr:Maf family protein [Verrucomicrobiota bacterium]